MFCMVFFVVDMTKLIMKLKVNQCKNCFQWGNKQSPFTICEIVECKTRIIQEVKGTSIQFNLSYN